MYCEVNAMKSFTYCEAVFGEKCRRIRPRPGVLFIESSPTAWAPNLVVATFPTASDPDIARWVNPDATGATTISAARSRSDHSPPPQTSPSPHFGGVWRVAGEWLRSTRSCRGNVGQTAAA